MRGVSDKEYIKQLEERIKVLNNELSEKDKEIDKLKGIIQQYELNADRTYYSEKMRENGRRGGSAKKYKKALFIHGENVFRGMQAGLTDYAIYKQYNIPIVTVKAVREQLNTVISMSKIQGLWTTEQIAEQIEVDPVRLEDFLKIIDKYGLEAGNM